MEITWYGLGCFRMTERGAPSVVTDPFNEDEVGLTLPRGRANIVTSSRLMDDPQDARWPGLRGVEHTIAGPGEYEIGGVFITGITASSERRRAGEAEQNVIYAINWNGVTVCHLGRLGRTPTQAQAEVMGRVNVLLLPVGLVGGFTGTMASETISLIEPDIVIPMEYKTPGLKVERKALDGFLKEMGATDPTPQPSLTVSASSEQEETQIVVLSLH